MTRDNYKSRRNFLSGLDWAPFGVAAGYPWQR